MRIVAVAVVIVCSISIVAGETSPIITNNRTVYMISDGEVTKIYCETQGDPKPSVVWEVGGSRFPEQVHSGNSTGYVYYNVSENGSLVVTNPRSSKRYGPVNVTCIANNSAGIARRTFKVVFLKTPIITNNRTEYEIPDGGADEIFCEAQGYPEPSVLWEVDGNVPGQFNFRVSGNATLSITNAMVSKRFGLVYVNCTARNTAGTAQRTFRVTFFKAPRILTKSKEIKIIENTMRVVNISCEVTGYPKPVIEWIFDHQSLNASRGCSRHHIHEFNGRGHTEVSFCILDGTLQIKNPLEKSYVPHEKFTCVARNAFGEDNRTHSLEIAEVESFSFDLLLPNEPTDLKNISKKILEAFQSGEQYFIVNITSINLEYRSVKFKLTWTTEYLNSNYGIPTDVAKLANDVLKALQKGGLNPERFRLNAKPAPPVNLAVVDVTSSEATISWKSPDHFEVDAYKMQRSGGPNNKWTNIRTISGNETSVTIGNLDSDTKYLFKLYSHNRHGTGKIPSEVLQVETEADPPVLVIVLVVVIVSVVLLGLVLGFVYHRRHKKRERETLVLMESNPYEDSIPGIPMANIYVQENRTFCFMADSGSSSVSWNEICRDRLDMGNILGQGEFGLVVKAVWRDEQTNENVTVAVKTVKDVATETDRKELFKELKLMSDVAEHPNVVNLIGACSKGGPLWIVVEFCENGNLLSYLKKNRDDVSTKEGTFVTSLDPLTRVRMAYDVSKGMHFLEDKKIVHRDLAARNVLLGKNKIAKVSDFGLSRDIYEGGLYEKKSGGKVPIKWMAIESLREAVYTSKSDVWSFGVLFWEIETAGVVPYPGISGRELLGHLLRGDRLYQPSVTSSEIYEIMKTCWEFSPKGRPSFKDLESTLESYLEERLDYLPVVIDEDDAVGANDATYDDSTVEPVEIQAPSTSNPV